MLYQITLILLIGLIWSIRQDNRSLRNPFLLIFFLIFAFFSVASWLYRAGFEWASDLLFLASFVILPLVIFLSGFLLLYNGVVLLRKEGYSKANLLSLGMGLAILFFFIFVYLRARFFDAYSASPWQNILWAYIIFTYLVFGLIFAGYMLYSLLYLFFPKNKKYDFIIIHGAGLLGGERVTPLLEKRILKAVEAYHRSKNPRIKLIASGGQGGDEKISEAQAIANYLYEHTDIPREDILLEDQSRTTYENLLFSKQIGETYMDKPHFLYVTNDYHVFRTSAYARQVGMAGDGLGCATANYYIPSAFIREYIAICVKLKWGILPLFVLFTLAILISYRGVWY